jgi:cytochrome P450
MPDPVIDLLDVRNFAGSQPHDQFAWLRANSPVHRHAEPGGRGFYAVTRFDDVKLVGREHEIYSSSPTTMITDPDPARTEAMGRHVMMLMADPPVHTKMRRLVSKRFTPRESAALTPRISELATKIVDEVVEAGECDLVTQLAGEMPSFVIADLVGIPLEDGRRLYHHTEMLHSSTAAVGAEAQQNAYLQMFEYAAKTYAAKKANPVDDLGSVLATASIDGEPVDEIDFFLWFLLLIDGGGDTTRNLVGGGIHTLLAHPDQLAWLLEDLDARLPDAIEELLRWVSPVIHMRRTVRQETELAGTALLPGDKVVIYYGAANRDAACVSDPDRFDITRTSNPHVAFGGGGPHYCLGSHIARIEITALLREMLTRLGDLRLVGETRWNQSNFIFGPTSMPVRFTPGPRVG